LPSPAQFLATVFYLTARRNSMALYMGIRASFWVATAIALLGALTSAVSR
jgi:hypothetical protein